MKPHRQLVAVALIGGGVALAFLLWWAYATSPDQLVK